MNTDSLIVIGYNLLYKLRFYEARLVLYKTYNRIVPVKSKWIQEKINSAEKERRNSILAEQYLRRIETHTDLNNLSHPCDGEKIIWQCWLQGEEQAPDIIQDCFQTVRKFQGDYKRVVITENNMHDYITLPDYIFEKYKNGIICKAHLSDLLRVYLLSKYGGVWLDASVYLIRNIPEDILQSNFFVFKRPKTKPHSRIIGNWFMVSKPQSTLIEMIKRSLTLFWEDDHEHIDYFIMHYLFSVAVRKNRRFKTEFKKIPFYSNRKPHLFDRILHSTNGCTDSRLKEYYNAFFCQKLSHRHENISEVINRIKNLQLNH